MEALATRILGASLIISSITCAYAATSVAGASTGAIGAVNTINVVPNGINITTSDSGAGMFNGMDAYAVSFSNNNVHGYKITAKPANGHFRSSTWDGTGTPTDGQIIHYKLSCAAFETLASTTETIAEFTSIDILNNNLIDLYNVTEPDAATCVADTSGCKATPTCDVMLAANEDIDEHFEGTFSETLQYEITNNS